MKKYFLISQVLAVTIFMATVVRAQATGGATVQGAAVQCPGDKWQIGDGEKLVFTASYRAAMVPNTDVAQVVFETKIRNGETGPVYHIKANGRVMPFFRWFFDVNDTYQAWLNVSTLRPEKYNGEIREGKYRYSTTFHYDWLTMQVNTSYRNHKRPTANHKTLTLSPQSFDAVSLFYNLRARDRSSFVQGVKQHLDLVLEDTIRRIEYRFLGREVKEIKGLGTFKTLKFSCFLASATGESFEDGTELLMWVSDDDNKIPLFIETPIRVGSVRARLSSYDKLQYPLDSKIR